MCGFDNNHKLMIIGFFVFMTVLFIPSMGYVINDSVHKNDPVVESGQCGEFPKNVSYLKVQKNIYKVWHWQYDFMINDVNGEVVMRCPTVQRDLNVIFNGVGVGRTDGEIDPILSTIQLLDCHNNKVYTIRTGNAFETIINSNKIFVSLEVRQNDTVINYINKLSLIVDTFDLYDTNSTIVATLKRNKINNLINLEGWSWDINITDPVNRPVDLFLLIAIAIEHSFSETDGNGNAKYDGCNNFSFAMLCIMIISGCMIFVGTIVLLNKCRKYRNTLLKAPDETVLL